jgi:hypothetical protein
MRLFTSGSVKIFTHTFEGTTYILWKERFERPVVLGKLIEEIPDDKVAEYDPRYIVRLYATSTPGPYVRFEPVPKELGEKVLKAYPLHKI